MLLRAAPFLPLGVATPPCTLRGGTPGLSFVSPTCVLGPAPVLCRGSGHQSPIGYFDGSLGLFSSAAAPQVPADPFCSVGSMGTAFRSQDSLGCTERVRSDAGTRRSQWLWLRRRSTSPGGVRREKGRSEEGGCLALPQGVGRRGQACPLGTAGRQSSSSGHGPSSHQAAVVTNAPRSLWHRAPRAPGGHTLRPECSWLMVQLTRPALPCTSVPSPGLGLC